MSFFNSANTKALLIESLRKRRLLLGPDNFNSISDYKLLKMYLKKIREFNEKGDYIYALVTFKVPTRRYRDIKTDIIYRYLIIGFDENDKIIVFYSDFPHEHFGFSYDIARYKYVDVEPIFEKDAFFRVQGDIIFQVEKVENPLNAYLDSLFHASFNVISNLLLLEIHRRIADLLSDLSISSIVNADAVFINGCPRNLKENKLVSYIVRNLVLSDIFPGYDTHIRESLFIKNLENTIVFDNIDNIFTLEVVPSIIGRYNPDLLIRARFVGTLLTKKVPEEVFFENIISNSKLTENINEIEVNERVGRHTIIFKNVFPRQVSIDFEFPISQRRYNIMLSTLAYVTSGTEIHLSHPQHGTKVVKVPAARIWLRHVEQPYRTVEAKNKLLLRHYFT